VTNTNLLALFPSYCRLLVKFLLLTGGTSLSPKHICLGHIPELKTTKFICQETRNQRLCIFGLYDAIQMLLLLLL